MFKVLRSSAGAGKTHALVKHYLTLALTTEDPSGYTRILALTFTNKAAGEMRERILQYLEALSTAGADKATIRDVRESIRSTVGISDAEVARRAQNTLTHILHHWPQFAVSTIDAFTRRVVMPFARDLRLDHDLRMTTEEEYYRSKAVDMLLEEAGKDVALTQLLIATCEQLLEDERAWRPGKPLLELSTQLSKEGALEHLRTLRDLSNEEFLRINESLRTRVRTFRDRIRALGRKAWQAMEEAGVTEKDLAHGASGPYGYVKNLLAFDTWQKENKNVLKALEKDKWHSGTAQGNTLDAVAHIAPILRSVIEEVEGAREKEMVDHAIASAVQRELMPTAALNALDQQLEKLKAEEGTAFFSDLTRKVAAIVQDEPAPFLYERLGERYKHFLIDEFQDTSLLQWHALLPLLENALSADGSALLVGDAKQAIYRWRNGEVRQFIELPKLFGKEKLTLGDEREDVLVRTYHPQTSLADNHRSANGIIAFNNALVGVLKEHLHVEDRAIFDAHEQHAIRTNAGHVRITCFEEEVDPELSPMLSFVEGAVREALDDGFRPGDIAILVRTKSQGRAIAEHLVAKGWSVVSPDGLTLRRDIGAVTAISVLTWLHEPNDQHTAHAAQHLALLHTDKDLTDPFVQHNTPSKVMQAWGAQHPRITARLPLVPLLCRIVEAVRLDPATDAFAMGLINEAHAFAKEHGDDVGGFLAHWEQVADKRSVGGTTGTTAIQIMTIHKSKGLQFPVVIVPEVGKRTGGNARDLLWIQPEPAIGAPPSALVQLKEPLKGFNIPEVQEEERLRALDDLDLLYVAFTRPSQRLYAGVDGKTKDRFAAALREHLGLAAGQEWTAGDREAALIDGTKEDPSLALSPSVGAGQRTLAIRQDAPEEWNPADPDPFRTHGRVLHAILARVNTLADLDEAVRTEAVIWGLPHEQQQAITQLLDPLLRSPQLAPFFSPGLVVLTESTFIDDSGHALRPDRIVRDGTTTRILDIKTGIPSDRHEEQVRRYAQILRALDGGDVSAHLLYVREHQLVTVDA